MSGRKDNLDKTILLKVSSVKYTKIVKDTKKNGYKSVLEYVRDDLESNHLKSTFSRLEKQKLIKELCTIQTYMNRSGSCEEEVSEALRKLKEALK